MGLKRSKDRKVTNSVTASGNARGANSFGLPSGKAFSCPGATSVCETVCYAGKLERIYSGVRNVLEHNWNMLKDADLFTMRELLSDMISDFRAESVKRGDSLDFRIHWDGDFFSETYAAAWAFVIGANSDIRFWVYTRSFFAIPYLADLPNLTVYLSVDSDNINEAKATRNEYPTVKWAWLGNSFAEGNADMPKIDKRYNCPENAGRIPLITDKGSACIRCGICPAGRGDVVFSVTKA